jgi:hypothetical protein
MPELHTLQYQVRARDWIGLCRLQLPKGQLLFLQGKKQLAEMISNSLGKGVSNLKWKKVKTLWMKLIAARVTVEVRQSQGSSAKVLAAF